MSHKEVAEAVNELVETKIIYPAKELIEKFLSQLPEGIKEPQIFEDWGDVDTEKDILLEWIDTTNDEKVTYQTTLVLRLNVDGTVDLTRLDAVQENNIDVSTVDFSLFKENS